MDDRMIDFSALLASIAHDMKNSLGVMLTATDEILSNCTPRACPSFHLISPLQYEAKRLNNSLVQLLTLYKMDMNQYAPNITYNSVFDFIGENVLANGPLLEMRNIRISVECDEDLAWFFDRDLLAGVVNNVLNNAYRYAGDRITISAFEEDGYLVISLHDNGGGYPQHLLDQSSGAPGSSNFTTGSTGLGIYFAHAVMKIHRNRGKTGYLSMRNGGALGGGEFRVHLP